MKSFGPISHEKYTGTFDDEALKHLLKRTLLGVKIEDFKKFSGKTLDQVIALIFKESVAPLPPVNHYESVTKDTTGVALGETWVNSTYGDGTINSRRQQSLKAWWTLQMHFQEATIHEKMNLFWHNHFATEINSYNDVRIAYKYLQTIRKFALGNFKDFTKAMTLEPAMLLYLNGTQNTKTAPDENYAREMQELFTLGKGPNSKYTEDDVKNAAKILTGYRVNKEPINSYFQADRHDSTDKTFSSFYGNKVIKGHTGDFATNELDELLNMIFEKEEVSFYIIRRLYTFFFYYDITPEIETKFITPLAKIFKDNKYEILPVLKVMFSSKHFFDAELRGCIIKSPVEHLIGTTKFLEPSWPVYQTFIYEYYLLANDLASVADRGQQVLGDPPSVAGWPAYYQAPVFHEIWINASTFPERTKFTDTYISKGYKRNTQSLLFDPIGFAKKLKTPADPIKLIDEMVFWLFQVPISTNLKTKLKTDILLAGQASDYYWTELWNDSQTKPTNNNVNMVTTKLKTLLSYFLALPEYQLS
jgi:uncharacterized protein (DUF1800 family)